MANRLTEALRIKTQEEKQIVLMLCTGFFMGIFIATYQVTADSLFLNRMSDQLTKALLIAGALGILSTALFSIFQNVIRFTTLALASIGLILVFTLVTYWLLHAGYPELTDYFIFALFCMSGPITAVLLLSFWGIFGRLFNFKQSKRIIGWIDTGQLIAAILATLIIIPFTTKIVPDTSNYLLLCAISITIVSILFVVISSSFSLSKNNPKEFSRAIRKEASVGKIFTDRYILTLSMFLMVSMFMFVFSQYSFQQIVTAQYPNERDLTNFNSFFIGAVYGISLIMQTFVNQKIISNYGLKISLFILPIVVAIFSLGSIISGSLMGFDKAISPFGFIYFFLFVALSRLFNWTLRDSIENPVFKLFFIPLDGRIRFNIQAKVEGLVNEGSRLLAGLAIFLLALLPSFNAIHISILMLVMAGIYFIVVSNMYNGYRGKIRLKLESSDGEQEKLEKGFALVTKKLESFLNTPSSYKAVFSYKLLEKINAAQVPVWINSMMKNEDEATRHYAQEKMNELKGLSVSDQYVIRLDKSKVEGEEKNVLSKIDLQMILDNGGDITKTRIMRLTRSTSANDRHYAAELLLHTSKDECISYLMELLTD
nr:hypothetical protein [Chryseolinea sp.]